MRGIPRPSSRLPRRRVESSRGVARRHWLRRSAWFSVAPHPPSCAPFAPGPLRPFVATMGALTPARAVAPVLGLSPAASRSAPREQVSLIHALGLPTLPSPTTCVCSASSGQGTLPHQRVGPRQLPHEPTLNGNSGLRQYLAGSPHHTGRIEFVSLRTGRSPPVAPHHASRLTSHCSEIAVTFGYRLRLPGEDFHLSDQMRFQAHQILRSAQDDMIGAFSAAC